MSASYQRALDDVKTRVAKSGTSFHAGMAILPKERRDAMYALYAFCREVDDIADDSLTPDDSARGLQKWRERIAALFQGQTSDTITSALAPAIQSYGLVEEDFQAIIDGMQMDSIVICAPSAAFLDTYCDRVASAVGRVSVRIFGDSSANAMTLSHHLGRAFQLTNILRDLAEDASRERLYLSEELLAKHNITSRKPEEVLRDPHLREACRELAGQARHHFQEADRMMQLCIPSAMRPAKIMRAYYGAIFDRLVKEDWRDPFVRVSLSRWEKLLLMLQIWVGRS